MKIPQTRRDFLAEVGRGMVLATVGYETATTLGLSAAIAEETSDRLLFGSLEPLVRLMQETPVQKLLPTLVAELDRGTTLKQLTAAAAMANARSFGGEDYVGYHTMMALAPAYYMAQELPDDRKALPVFKVLYRNTARIQERGLNKGEVLKKLDAASPGQTSAEELRKKIRSKDMAGAESDFAAIAQNSLDDAWNALLMTVQDNADVHRAVLPYRAWDLVGLIGKEQAHTLLRQSVHYCVSAETGSRESSWNEPRSVVPKAFEEYKLLGLSPGSKKGDDKWVDDLSQTILKSSPEDAVRAVGAALAEGFAIDDVGEAVCLAANQLVLRDPGRDPRSEFAGKPIGSVHGDSIGVHASDAANAWRNMARVSNPRNSFACLMLGAFQTARDRTARGIDVLNFQPLPVPRHLEDVKATDREELIAEAEEAIKGNLQARASAIAHKYGALGHQPKHLFAMLLRYAITEDGALHAEKYYRTVVEEFNATRPAFRWRHLVGLARVTASEFGRPAPGIAEARTLLNLS